jgi:hypothetical protein
MFNVFLQIVGLQVGYTWTKPQIQSRFKREISKQKKTGDNVRVREMNTYHQGTGGGTGRTISRSPWQMTPSRGSLTLHF